MFDKNPIFTTKGTCYTTNATIYEHSPFIYSSIKIWIHELKENTPGTVREICGWQNGFL